VLLWVVAGRSRDEAQPAPRNQRRLTLPRQVAMRH
jgi:hypothetical protein